MKKPYRPNHIQVLNLAGSEYDDDLKILRKAIEELPEVFEIERGDVHHLPWSHQNTKVPVDFEEKLLQELKEHVAEKLTSLSYVVLLEEEVERDLDSRIVETLGWYTDDCRVIPHLEEVVKAAKGRHPKENWDALAQFERDLKHDRKVPLVALHMNAIHRASVEWRNEGHPAPHCKNLPYLQREWLTVMVLRHELGHHVFPLDRSQYAKYGTDNEITKLAEGGANLFSWLIETKQDRLQLERFVRHKQPPPYKAYQELLMWAMPSRVSSGYWSPGLAVATWAFGVDTSRYFGALPSSELRSLITSISNDFKQPNWFRPRLEATANSQHFLGFIQSKESGEAMDSILKGAIR